MQNPTSVRERAKRDGLKLAIMHFGFFYSGGGEKLVLEEVKGLRALGHEVECFAPYVDRDHCFPDIPEMREIRTLLPPPPSWLPLRHAIWVLACCVLAPLFSPKFRTFDVLFAANQPSAWIVHVISRILKKRYVIYLAQPLRLLHPREIDKQLGLRIKDGDQNFVRWVVRIGKPLIDWADRRSVREAFEILANGSYVADWLRMVYGRSSIDCPAGCYPAHPDALSYSHRWVGRVEVNGTTVSKPFILLTNRHAPQKRFEFALWALKRMIKEMPEISLVITGQETHYTDQLRYLAQGLRLESSVHFVGLVNEADLSRLYGEAAVYVYPSPDEDFGMGIAEAMAAGTPVVAWRRGGPTVTVNPGKTGFLVTPYDTDEFAERLLMLAQNPELAARMGRAGNRRARALFTYERHAATIENHVLNAANRLPEPMETPRPNLSPMASLEVGSESGVEYETMEPLADSGVGDSELARTRHESL